MEKKYVEDFLKRYGISLAYSDFIKLKQPVSECFKEYETGRINLKENYNYNEVVAYAAKKLKLPPELVDIVWNDANDDYIIEKMRVNGFKYGGLWPLSWTISARNLKRAADKLFEIYYNASMRDLSREINLAKEALIGKNDSTSMELEGEELDDFNDEQMISVYFFLIGLALENLIKGILLTLNPTYLSDTKLSNEIKTHNLLYLYNKCGLSLRNNDKTILIKLSRYILWLGRYPIPLSIDSMLPIKEDDGVVIQRGESHADILRTQEAIEDLYRRLMMKLNEAKDHAKI